MADALNAVCGGGAMVALTVAVVYPVPPACTVIASTLPPFAS